MNYNANTKEPPKLRANIDFTHCKEGWCKNCSRERQIDCEDALELEAELRRIQRGQQPTQKPIIHLCDRHYHASDWGDKEVVLTGRQSCEICQEK